MAGNKGARPKRLHRTSMDSLDLIKFPSEKTQNGDSHHNAGVKKDFSTKPARSKNYKENQSSPDPKTQEMTPVDAMDVRLQMPHLKINRAPSDEECFFDLLSKFQSNRMDDQRCTLEESQSGGTEPTESPVPAMDDRISTSSLMASPQTEEFF